MKRVLVAGASGHARVVCDAIHSEGRYEVAGFVTPDLEPGTRIGSATVLGSDRDVLSIAATHGVCGFVCGMGVNELRRKVTEKLLNLAPDLAVISVRHRSAVVAPDVVVGPGTVIMAGAIINSGSRIGDGCIINTRASVDHDCVLGDFASIGPAVALGGGCGIGCASFIGLGAMLMHNVSVGCQTVVGAGSLVTKDLSHHIVAYGVPARVVRQRKSSDPYL